MTSTIHKEAPEGRPQLPSRVGANLCSQRHTWRHGNERIPEKFIRLGLLASKIFCRRASTKEPRSALKHARLVILYHDSFEQFPRNQLDECHNREHAGASLEIDSGNFIA
jgi:hypothetical protein